MRFGGLPEVAKLPSELRDEYLKQLFQDIIYRDIVQRHEVRTPRALEEVAHFFLVNTACEASYNRVKNKYKLAIDQVRDYAGYLEESYLIGEVRHLSFKVSQQANLPRKVYARDTGLRNAVSFQFSPDTGRLAETLVFNELSKPPGTELFYFKGRNECDFVVWQDMRPVLAVQVCYPQDDPLPERELDGLREVMEKHHIAQGLVVTASHHRKLEEGTRTIQLVPLDWWLFTRTRAMTVDWNSRP